MNDTQRISIASPSNGSDGRIRWCQATMELMKRCTDFSRPIFDLPCCISCEFGQIAFVSRPMAQFKLVFTIQLRQYHVQVSELATGLFEPFETFRYCFYVTVVTDLTSLNMRCTLLCFLCRQSFRRIDTCCFPHCVTELSKPGAITSSVWPTMS